MVEPESQWPLRDRVSWPETRFSAANESRSINHARQQRVKALLNRYDNGASILEAIDTLAEQKQKFVFHWVDVIARSDSEVARVFAGRAVKALELMDQNGVEAWIIRSMDAYDRHGLGHATSVLEDPETFAEDYALRNIEVSLDKELGVLQPFIIGLGGRPLTINMDESVQAEMAYTDSEAIYLPPKMRQFSDQTLNRQLLMAQAVYLWAQNRYGTWQLQPIDQLLRSPDAETAIAIFARLECYRIEACLKEALPGVARSLQYLNTVQGIDRSAPSKAWQSAIDAITDPAATALDSIDWIDRLRNEPLPEAPGYLCTMYPDRVRQLVRKRVDSERERLQRSLSELEQRLAGNSASTNDKQQDNPTTAPKSGGQFSIAGGRSTAGERQTKPQLEYEGRRVETPPDVQGLLTSIQQDLGEVPDDYLAGSADDTPYDADAETPMDREYTSESLHDVDGVLSYPEWDYNRQRYRQDYCLLQEHTVKPGDPNFIQQTLQKYRGPLKSIRRSFEAVLGEDRLLRRQADGDDLDIDALIEAQADLVRGAEMDDRVYSRHRRVDRDIAVMFMVDMSGSTRGWVNDAERESLVLLCEALETLGDRYAIYGFSGRTHSRCAIYHIKRFDETYGRDVRDRISGIKPQTYTRMGVAIRHLGGLLNQVPARTKLLVTLSDGKPEDYGSYRGRYGIEDTRRALVEARRNGIHSFCITIDSEGGDYLPHMYGPANYAVIDQVSQLPLKVADIYRKLTT